MVKSFWFHILRLLGRKYRLVFFIWGAIFWGTLAQQTIFYHYHNSLLTLHMKGFQVYVTSSSFVGNQVLLPVLCLADYILIGLMDCL